MIRLPREIREMFTPGRLLVISVLSAFFLAVGKVGDNIIVNNFFKVPDDKFVSVIAYVIVGSWIGAGFSFLFAKVLGKWIDKEFKGLSFKSWGFHKLAIISGITGAAGTVFYLLASLENDPSVVTALGSFVALYALAYEFISQRRIRVKYLIAALMILFGGILTTLVGIDANKQIFTLSAIFWVGIASGVFMAISEQKGKTASEFGGEKDPINLQVWRFFWFALFATPSLIVVSVVSGNLPDLLANIQAGLIKSTFGFYVFVLMVFVFVGEAMKQHLKVEQNSVSKVLLTTSASILFVYPFTWLISFVKSDIYGSSLPTDSYVLAGRYVGAAILIVGVIFLDILHTRAEKQKQNSKS